MRSISCTTTPRPTRRAVLRALGVFALSATALACRGASPPPAAGTARPSLRLLIPSLGLPNADAQLAKAVEEAARTAEIAVAVQSASEDELRTALAAAATEAPDLALLDRLAVARLRRGGGLRDVSAIVVDAIGFNGPVPANIAALLQHEERKEKRWYGVPFLSRGVAWLARADFLAERGVAAPKTYAELAEAAARLAEPGAGRSGMALPFTADPWAEALAEHLILSFGGSLADATGRRVVLNSPATVEAARFVGRLGRESWLWRGASLEQLAHDFRDGRVALVPPTPGLYARLAVERTSSGGSVSVIASRKSVLALPLPAGPKQHVTGGASYHFVAPSRAPADVVHAFLRQLLRPSSEGTPLGEIIRQGGGELVPPYAYLTKDPFWDEDPNYQALALGTRGARPNGPIVVEPGHPGPARAEVAEVERQRLLSRLFRRVLEGQALPEDAVRQAHDEAEAAFRAVRV